MLLLLAPGCSIFHDLWFHAEDESVIHDSGNNVVDDCSWFDDPKNCWNTLALAAATCVPDTGRTGEFEILPPKEPIDSAAPPLLGDCSYLPTNPSADVVVKFGAPITLPLTRSTLNFTVEIAGGADCASVAFPDGEDTLKLTVEGAGVFEQTEGDNAPVYQCPDGTKVEPTFSELASCNVGESHVPGVALTSTDTELTATIAGNAGDAIQLFRCLVPEVDTGEQD
jgi:hypothetical protein